MECVVCRPEVPILFSARAQSVQRDLCSKMQPTVGLHMQGGARPPHAGLGAGGGIFVTHQHGLPGYQGQLPGNSLHVPWSTGDAALDEWLRRSFLLDDIFHGLARLPVAERKKIALAVSGKGDSIRDPSKYMLGCIRKSLEQSNPYSSSFAGQLSVGAGGVAGRHADVLTVARPLLASSQASSTHSSGSGHSMFAASGGVATNVAEHVPLPTITLQPAAGRFPSEITNDQQNGAACPDWVMEAAAELPSKSKLVNIVYKNLSGQNVANLSQLPPLAQYVACTGILLAVQRGQDAQTAATQIFVSSQSFNWHVPSLPRSPSAGKNNLSVVILLMGAFSGMGQVAVKAALTFAATDIPDMQLHVLETHCFAVDSVAADMEQATATSLKTRVQVWNGVNQSLTVICDRKGLWRQQGVKVLVLHAMSFGSVGSDAHSLPGHNEVVGSSSPPDLWTHLRSMKVLATEIDSQHVAQFLWMDRPLHGVGPMDPEVWFGERCEIDCSNYKPVASVGCLHMQPRPTKPIMGRCVLWNVKDPVDGIAWGPAMRSVDSAVEPANSHMTLSAKLLTVPEKRVFGQHELTEGERQLWLSAQGIDSSGAMQLMTPKHIMALLGMHDTPLPLALQAAFPCYRHILPTTGQSAENCVVQGESCGKSRWCVSCEQSLRQAFRAPHPGMLTDHIVAWAGAALRTWLGQGAAAGEESKWVDLSQYPDC